MRSDASLISTQRRATLDAVSIWAQNAVMSRPTRNISAVAPPRKGYDAERTLRYQSRLKEPLELLAWINHRTSNDEIVVAIEEHLKKHAPKIDEARARRRDTK